MRIAPSGLQSSLRAGSAGLCWCVTITRREGYVYGMTDWDSPLTIDGQVFNPIPGMVVSSIPYGLDGFSSGVDISFGATNNETLTPFYFKSDDIRDGNFDGGEVRLYQVNALNPGDGALEVFWGYVADVNLRFEGGAKLSAKGILSLGTQIVVDRYAPMCIWYFADTRCGLDPVAYTFNGVITAIPDLYTLILGGDVLSQPDDAYKNGVLEVTSGKRANMRIEGRGWEQATGTFKTFLSNPRSLAVGDTVKVLRGCGKRFQDCQAYGNYLRFGGQQNAGTSAEAANITYQDWGV